MLLLFLRFQFLNGHFARKDAFLLVCGLNVVGDKRQHSVDNLKCRLASKFHFVASFAIQVVAAYDKTLRRRLDCFHDIGLFVEMIESVNQSADENILIRNTGKVEKIGHYQFPVGRSRTKHPHTIDNLRICLRAFASPCVEIVGRVVGCPIGCKYGKRHHQQRQKQYYFRHACSIKTTHRHGESNCSTCHIHSQT